MTGHIAPLRLLFCVW